MRELSKELFEQQLTSIAKGLDYPRTPNIAGSVMKRLPLAAPRRILLRRFAWSLTVVLILFSSLMLIPPARAAILEFIQIGIVRIFPAAPTPVISPQQESPGTVLPVPATPSVTSEPLIPILERMAGEKSLA